MTNKIRQVHGRIIFNDGPERWQAPNPEYESFDNARHVARYPRPGQYPNYLAAELGDVYTYLVSVCPTTKDALQKLREIRRAVRELREVEE